MKLSSANINVLVKACRKASKILIRDFGEVEKLQVSLKGPGDFVTIADKKVLRPKEEIYEWLKTEKSKSGNRLWQKIRKGPGKFSFGQIYLIRAKFREPNLNDEYMCLQFARGYGPKTKEAQRYYYERC